MIFYVIMHKATGLLMPQARKSRGYSHWNPTLQNGDNQVGVMQTALGYPRLFDTRRRAAGAISQWAANPNARFHHSMSYYGEEDNDVISKPDGRSKDDLIVVEVSIEGLPEEARF